MASSHHVTSMASPIVRILPSAVPTSTFLPFQPLRSSSLNQPQLSPKGRKERGRASREPMKPQEQGNSPLRKDARLQAAMEELIRGQEQAAQLLSLLKEAPPQESVRLTSAAELSGQVLASLSRAISFLQLERSSDEDPTPPVRMTSSTKRKIRAPRRTSDRSRAHPYTCKTFFSTKIEDGYTWRKYGQKEIFGSMHARSYYRCIHKHDRGCLITKQVQRTEEDESIFSITYMGKHTCVDAAAAKQECIDEIVSNYHSAVSSSSDILVFLETAAGAGGSAPYTHFSPPASDQQDVTSAFRSSIQFAPEAFEFDDLLAFDLDEYTSK